MAAKTIMTPFEVIQFSAFSDGFETEHIATVLPIKEPKLFREAFGLDYYNDLLNRLSDPYKEGDDVPEYNEGSSYATDDRVIFDDNVYISKVDSNVDNPLVTTSWGLLKKFSDTSDNDKFNALWDYIKYWIANGVASEIVKAVSFKTGAAGAMKKRAQEGEWGTIPINEIHSLKADYVERSEDAFEEMFYFMVHSTKMYKDSAGVTGYDFSDVDRVANHFEYSTKRNLPRRRRVSSIRDGRFRNENW
jgi:hypothetical protein